MTNSFLLRHQVHTHHSLVISMPNKSTMTYLLVFDGSQEILLISLMQAAKSLRIVPLALSHK